MRKFFIITLGCKVNQFESDAMAQFLKDSGWGRGGSSENADVCVINTCAVTQKASMQSRQAVRQAIRSHPGARIIVTGCHAQVHPGEFEKIPGVNEIIGHFDKHNIPAIVLSGKNPDRSRATVLCRNSNIEHDFQQMPTTPIGTRTRPFLKIQDGCNAFCSYCIVPYARGRSRSLPPEQVFEHIERLGRSGAREIVLTGIHLGAYGRDLSPQTDLFSLMKQIDASAAIDRVRISSVEPVELTDDIILLVAGSERFCDHFHIPLQSGDDRILQRMNRPYSSRFFEKLVDKIHALIPAAGIGVDTLIGFPGETDAAFNNTRDLIESIPASYLHVFPFSPRAGTPASRFEDAVSPQTIKERCAEMRGVGNKKRKAFLRRLIDRNVEVLFEARRHPSNGLLKGITANYVAVLADGDDGFINELVDVRVEALFDDRSVEGTIIK